MTQMKLALHDLKRIKTGFSGGESENGLKIFKWL